MKKKKKKEKKKKKTKTRKKKKKKKRRGRTPKCDRLVGKVVEESASRVAGPGFDSRLDRGDFPGRVIPVAKKKKKKKEEKKMGTPVVTLPGAWHYSISAGTGWPDVSPF